MIAEVIINSNVKTLNRIFDYSIPDNLLEKVKIGSRIVVPFGNGKKIEEGFVIGIKDKSNYKVKEIIRVIEGFYLTKENIDLSIHMSKNYFCNISDCIKLMLPPGTATRAFENRVKEKHVKAVYLNREVEEIYDEIKSEKQKRVLNILRDNDGIILQDLEMVSECSIAIIKTLEKNGHIQIVDEQVDRNPFKHKDVKATKNLPLTDEQHSAYNKINKSIEENKFSKFLLYGVTGSGKTEVYLQLIEAVLKKGKTAIVLVPEISLTPQMVDRFLSRFGDTISVLHSKLSIGERYDQWNRILNDESKIVIGARSAIFAPVKNIGIVIIDEEHDTSYKSDTTPRYDAKYISEYICKQNDIPLVLGSATPDINTFYMTQERPNKETYIQLLPLTKRANNSNLPNIEIVDLRQELACGNKTMISLKLHTEIEENLKNKKQTILFLNRRGFSTFVMCRDCGYTAKCKNCNITLTYHLHGDRLKCHYCGYESKNYKTCPSCNSKNIRHFGTGTQKLEEEIKRVFPSASTIRMDIDTTTKKNSHEEILNKFKEENIDILIGTQMVVKGHHFPNVTLVGVIAADASLSIEDYRAGERTFQILTQVAGRAGRENSPGKVVIQTYNPDSLSINYAKEQDYDMFYDTEIALRKQLKYPPFCDILLIGISGIDEKEVESISNMVYEVLKKSVGKYKAKARIFMPVPAPINKIKNRHRWRIILKCYFDDNIIDLINNMLSEYEKMKLKDARIIVDVNPNNLM